MKSKHLSTTTTNAMDSFSTLNSNELLFTVKIQRPNLQITKHTFEYGWTFTIKWIGIHISLYFPEYQLLSIHPIKFSWLRLLSLIENIRQQEKPLNYWMESLGCIYVSYCHRKIGNVYCPRQYCTHIVMNIPYIRLIHSHVYI